MNADMLSEMDLIVTVGIYLWVASMVAGVLIFIGAVIGEPIDWVLHQLDFKRRRAERERLQRRALHRARDPRMPAPAGIPRRVDLRDDH